MCRFSQPFECSTNSNLQSNEWVESNENNLISINKVLNSSMVNVKKKFTLEEFSSFKSRQ